MKNLVIISVLFAVSAIGIACSKNDASEPSGGTMSASVNGVAWSSTEVNDASNKLQKIISGQNKKTNIGVVINIEVASAVTGKVITLNRANVYEGITYQEWAADGFTPIDIEVAGSGTITITNVTKTLIEGTFSSRGPKRTITDGKFSMTLTKFF
jgi:hypothetical protein